MHKIYVHIIQYMYMTFSSIQLKDLWQTRQFFTNELYFQVFTHCSLHHNYKSTNVAFCYYLIRLCAVLGPVPKDTSE